MIKNYLKLTPLDIPNLIGNAMNLPSTGRLSVSDDGLVYLDLPDSYIHELYPLLASYSDTIIKPEYFGQKSAGAHISVIYPEENTPVDPQELGKLHQFEILQAVAADLGAKRYYVLTVNAPTLMALRNKHHLGSLLNFKNYWINLHITIGIAFL
ncbi:hypothetical protein [Legionella cardiaca]|uniref:Swiss Army Knife 2H phosphoesterase domain-containing protein n=1 Tax=Legionella cardiaca TaxID=1071983 RepID=A0ABY8ATP9_9GAMM|nr:hypothetical protein [Legionella cardiaca]WED44043.1 hypothetical protein PXX05_04450 [Legionella cardiaca]